MKRLITMKRLIAMVFTAALLLTGCGTGSGSGTAAQPGRSSLSESQAADVELPPIVFLRHVSNRDVAEEWEPEPQDTVLFFSKDGSCYISDDETLSAMSASKIASEFENGTIQDSITLHAQCEPDELEEQYLKVYNALTSGDFQIIDPLYGPAVQASTTTWYGMYYDKYGEFQCRLIHKTDAMGEHVSDNDILNEVYAWLSEHTKRNIDAADQTKQTE